MWRGYIERDAQPGLSCSRHPGRDIGYVNKEEESPSMFSLIEASDDSSSRCLLAATA